MPNHLHLLVSAPKAPDSLAFKLSHCLPLSQWLPVPPPQPVPDLHHLTRQIRYVHLNPCRKELCVDPLAWEWSTHRDYIGAVTYPWPRTLSQLHTLGFAGSLRGATAFHKYVSADPSVHPLGSSPPSPQGAITPHVLRLDEICRAAELITRAPRGAFQRKGRRRAQLMRLLTGSLGIPAVKVAHHFGVNRSSSLAVRPDRQQRLDPRWLGPLLMTLQDQRLLNPASREEGSNVAFRQSYCSMSPRKATLVALASNRTGTMCAHSALSSVHSRAWASCNAGSSELLSSFAMSSGLGIMPAF